MLPVPPPADRIARHRFATWMSMTNAARLRLVCAPLGSGKTAALAEAAARGGDACALIAVPIGAGATFVREALAQPAPVMIFDDAERLDRDAMAHVLAAANRGGPHVILASRSRIMLGAHALLARGLATRCDPALLAMDRDEVGRLAQHFGVAYDDADLDAIVYETEGWALAASWLVRDAAEEGRSLRDAPARWRERNGHLLLEFVAGERWTTQRENEAFIALLASGWSAAQPELEHLEGHGFPLVRTAHGVRPYRILARLAAERRNADDRMSMRLPAPMIVNLLGKFRCEIGGRSVQFGRRRDQQLFAYVALADGGVSRKTLIQEFWSGTEPQIAAQSLRTALSRIRRAIAEALPGGDPERYFTTEGDVRMAPGVVVVDARRFVQQVEEGRFDDGRGDVHAAIAHYRSAHRAYAGGLLEAEGIEPCLARRAAQLEALRLEVLRRLAALHAAAGEHELAGRFATELQSHSSAATA